MANYQIKGENNPRWAGGKLIACPICGIEKWKKPYQIKHGKIYCSRKCGFKGRDVHPKRGIDHPKWKGDNANYFVKHKWIRKNYGKANKCEVDILHKSTRYHWANISKKYKRERSDWMQMCPSCNLKDR